MKVSSRSKENGSLLSKIDIYGHTPTILYNGQLSFTSKYGGYMTLLVLVSYAMTIVFTVWRYFQRTSPETNVNQQFESNPAGFYLSKDSLPFALGLQKGDGSHFIDDSIYRTEAKFVYVEKQMVDGELQAKFSTIELPLVRCSEASLDPGLFQNLDLPNMWCLKEYLVPANKLKVTGVWESSEFGRLEVNFFRCKNKPGLAPCGSEEEIEALLRNSYFAINYATQTSKTTDYENPVQRYPASYFTSTSTGYTKYLIAYMQDNEIVTESSLIGYSEPNVRKFESLASFRVDISNFIREGEAYPDKLLEFVVRMQQMKVMTNRKYKNIYEYLAEFGGLAQVITLAGILLTFRMRKINMFMDLAEKIVVKEEAYQKLVEQTSNTAYEKALIAASKKDKSGTILGSHSERRPKGSSKPVLTEDVPIRQDSNNSSRSRSPSKGDRRAIPEEGNDRNTVRDRTLNMCNLSKVGKSLIANKLKYSNPNTTPSSNFQVDTPGNHQSRNADKADEAFQNDIEDASAAEILKIIRESKKMFKDEQRRFEVMKEQMDSIGCFNLFLKGFMPCLTKNSRVESAVEIAQKHFYSKYDLLKIIEVIEEFEKLKSMLMTKEQKVLFDFIPATKLKYIEGKNRFTVIADHRTISVSDDTTSQDRQRQLITKAFDSIKHQRDKSELDRNLLKCLAFLYHKYEPSTNK